MVIVGISLRSADRWVGTSNLQIFVHGDNSRWICATKAEEIPHPIYTLRLQYSSQESIVLHTKGQVSVARKLYSIASARLMLMPPLIDVLRTLSRLRGLESQQLAF